MYSFIIFRPDVFAEHELWGDWSYCLMSNTEDCSQTTQGRSWRKANYHDFALEVNSHIFQDSFFIIQPSYCHVLRPCTLEIAELFGINHYWNMFTHNSTEQSPKNTSTQFQMYEMDKNILPNLTGILMHIWHQCQGRNAGVWEVSKQAVQTSRECFSGNMRHMYTDA